MFIDKKILGINYIYIRKTSSTIENILFLRTTKKHGIVNIVEIPVYPYKSEKIKSLKSFIGYYQDLLLNKIFAKKYIDLIVNYNGFEKIFNVKAIPIKNGIKVNSIEMNTKTFKDSEINIGTASSMAYWHGYDRIIQGLYQYYKSNNVGIKIFLHFVGEGPETNKYKKLCKDYKLNDKVFFYGQSGGEKLDNLFKKFDLGIVALGIFRKDLDKVSSIKTSEFCARGIPFIYAGNEEGLNGKEKFALKISNDDAPVDIEKVIKFYINIRKDKALREKMRGIANERFSWNKQYEKIFSNID